MASLWQAGNKFPCVYSDLLDPGLSARSLQGGGERRDFISTVTDSVLEAVIEWQESTPAAQLSGDLFRCATGDPR